MDKVNEIKINVPEGMEAYLEDNTIKFKVVKKKLTYNDIAKELFDNKDVWRIENFNITKYNKTGYWNYLTNCISEKQAQKFIAINQLMNVAKYLNGNWQPNWNDETQDKYCFTIEKNTIVIHRRIEINNNIVYFKTTDFAQKTIDILGEETIKLALCTDW